MMPLYMYRKGSLVNQHGLLGVLTALEKLQIEFVETVDGNLLDVRAQVVENHVRKSHQKSHEVPDFILKVVFGSLANDNSLKVVGV